jgi:hypothetical protein
MSKRKRNKGKRQRQKKAQGTHGANNAANASSEAGLYDADDADAETESGSDETPVAAVVPAPRATVAPARPALRSVDAEPAAAAVPARAKPTPSTAPVAKNSGKVQARSDTSASGVTEIEGEDWGRFASLAALFAFGSFVTVSVAAALWKGTPTDGQSVNVTTGLMGGVIGVFGPLGTFVVGTVLMGLAATQIIAPRPLRWLLALAALPALAVGGAWLTGMGSVGALLGGNLMALGILLGLIGLTGGVLLVAMAHGFSLERLRPKREAKVQTEDEVEVRPLASAKAAPVLAAAVAPAAKAPAPVAPVTANEPVKSVEPAKVVEPAPVVAVAPAAVPDRDHVQPLGGGAPVAAPIAKPAPPEPERNVVRVLGGASDAPAAGAPVAKVEAEAPKELEVRILKRGVPVSNTDAGEIQVAPHEGEIDEPRPYVPQARAASAPAPAVAPKRTVTFASADDGATASVAPAPVAPTAAEAAPRPMGGDASEVGADVAVAEAEEWEPVAANAAPAKIVDDAEELEDDEEWDEEDGEEEEDEESDGGSVAVLEDGSEEESDEDDEEWEYEEEDEDDEEVEASDSDDEDEEDDEEWEYEEVEETDEVLASDAEEEDDDEEDDEDSESTAAEASEEDDDEEWEYEEEEEPEEVLASADEAEDVEEPVRETAVEAVVAEPVAQEAQAEVAEAEAAPEVVVAEVPSEEPVEAVAETLVEEPEPQPEPAPKKRASRSKKKAAAEAEPVVADPAVPVEQRSLFAHDSEENDVVLTPTAPSAPKDRERLLFEAGRMFVVEGRVAVSMLQKRFGLDFKESTEVMDELQERGLIGPYMGGSRREILMDADTWRETVGVG